ncbi:hypothetical protein ILYODFUR_015424 [Ilyodon furcidens]|uniref:Uncharacterized protein n=1 Tax=Ilyodon furcidens TaxID=33524 RepID=A0ABV0UGB2_9TELE
MKSAVTPFLGCGSRLVQFILKVPGKLVLAFHVVTMAVVPTVVTYFFADIWLILGDTLCLAAWDCCCLPEPGLTCPLLLFLFRYSSTVLGTFTNVHFQVTNPCSHTPIQHKHTYFYTYAYPPSATHTHASTHNYSNG